MTGMTGTAPATAVTAVQALGGTLDGPPTENGVSNQNPAAGAGGAGAGGDTGVPYRLQTGLTKYAPMQPIPPTKITKKNPTPLNPTSAYSIAKTWMPQPTILTTITASQTFSVSSMENTVSRRAPSPLYSRVLTSPRPLLSQIRLATWRSSSTAGRTKCVTLGQVLFDLWHQQALSDDTAFFG